MRQRYKKEGIPGLSLRKGIVKRLFDPINSVILKGPGIPVLRISLLRFLTMFKIVCCLIFSFLFAVDVARAVEVSGINVANIPVQSASKKARKAGLQKALGQVLVKMSGNPEVMTLPMIQNVVSHPTELIQSYGYSNKNPQNQPNAQAQLMLQVTFDRDALKQLLESAGQAVWSRDRPLTLFWIKVEGEGKSQVLSNTKDDQLSQDVLIAAKMRGIPMVLPTSSSIQQAEKRYGAKAMLSGEVQQNGNQWRGQWTLSMNNTPYRWNNTAKSVGDLLTHAVNDMANLMANQLAVVDKKALQADVVLEITSVNGLSEYAKIMSRLRQLPLVADVSVQVMGASDLLLHIKAIGGTQALSNVLSSGHCFSALDPSDYSNRQADLYYKYNAVECHD